MTAGSFTLSLDPVSVSASVGDLNEGCSTTVGNISSGVSTEPVTPGTVTANGLTGGTLTPTFNTAVDSTSRALDPAGVAASASSAVFANIEVLTADQLLGVCTSAGVWSYRLANTISVADLAALTAATARPEYRLPAGAFSTLAGTAVPLTVVPLTIS